MASNDFEYDVFISYAVEDRISIVTELVEHLKNSGLKVWYAGQELRVGKSIEEVIREGLNKSRYGVVILTHNYFTKDWPKKELHALWGKSDSIIIPIWHNLTTEEVKKYDPLLADKWGIESSKGIEVITTEILKAIQETKKEKSLKSHSKIQAKKSIGFRNIASFMGVGVISMIAIWFFFIRDLPSNTMISATIEKRINTFQKQIMDEHNLEMSKKSGKAATIQQITDYYNRYENIAAQYRNEYSANTGYSEFNFKKNVEPAFSIDLDLLSPINNYDFIYPNIFVIDYLPNPHTMDVKTIFINSQPTEYKIVDEQKTEDKEYLVEVKYENNVRYFSVDYTYSKRSDWIKRRQITIQGFLPKETYRFEKDGTHWVFVGLN